MISNECTPNRSSAQIPFIKILITFTITFRLDLRPKILAHIIVSYQCTLDKTKSYALFERIAIWVKVIAAAYPHIS